MPTISAKHFFKHNKTRFLSFQKGFTLLEIMVALVIFAMLSLMGLQVFNSLNKTKERAKIHTDALSDLQYAYLQLQNDFNQIVAWQTKQLNKKPNSTDTPNKQQVEDDQNNSPNTNSENNSINYTTPDFFTLEPNSISFIRFADPDPRYQSSPTLIRVSYKLVEKNLVRQQFFSLAKDSKSLDSVVLKNVTEVNWQALLPEPTDNFSSIEKQSEQSNPQNDIPAPTPMLPKGVNIHFMYQEIPIEWIFTLPNESPALASNYKNATEETDENNPQPPQNNPNKNEEDNNQE